MPASIPIKHRGTLASRAAIRPRAIFSRKTIAPWSSRPIKCRVLACIDANGVSDCSGCLMGHSDVLLLLLIPLPPTDRFGAGARPVHLILGLRAPTQYVGSVPLLAGHSIPNA